MFFNVYQTYTHFNLEVHISVMRSNQSLPRPNTYWRAKHMHTTQCTGNAHTMHTHTVQCSGGGGGSWFVCIQRNAHTYNAMHMYKTQLKRNAHA